MPWRLSEQGGRFGPTRSNCQTHKGGGPPTALSAEAGQRNPMPALEVVKAKGGRIASSRYNEAQPAPPLSVHRPSYRELFAAKFILVVVHFVFPADCIVRLKYGNSIGSR